MPLQMRRATDDPSSSQAVAVEEVDRVVDIARSKKPADALSTSDTAARANKVSRRGRYEVCSASSSSFSFLWVRSRCQRFFGRVAHDRGEVVMSDKRPCRHAIDRRHRREGHENHGEDDTKLVQCHHDLLMALRALRGRWFCHGCTCAASHKTLHLRHRLLSPPPTRSPDTADTAKRVAARAIRNVCSIMMVLHSMRVAHAGATEEPSAMVSASGKPPVRRRGRAAAREWRPIEPTSATSARGPARRRPHRRRLGKILIQIADYWPVQRD